MILRKIQPSNNMEHKMKKKPYFLSIDQGTTGTTALIIDRQSLKIISKVNVEFKQYFPKSSWVEHDLNEIWESVETSCLLAMEKAQITKNDIAAIGITNQRETTCAYNKNGDPLAPAIVWQDRRTHEFCQAHKEKYQSLSSLTGLPLDPYFSATKMNWLLNHNPAVMEASKNNNLRLSTIDTYLLYKLTDTQSFKTDATNASRTLLMNLETCQWENSLLNFFNINPQFLPTIHPNTHFFGKTSRCSFLADETPITCMIGDQQAALLGQGGVKAGDIKCTYGTGAFLLLNTGMNIIPSKNGLLTTVAFKDNFSTSYALEGSTYIAGAIVQWLRDNLNMIEKARDIEALAQKVSNEEIKDLFFFPFFTGIAAPYWNSSAKAALIGLTRASNKNHIARAALEGISLSVCDALDVFQKESPYPIEKLKVDGGAAANDLLLKMQSAFSNLEIIRSEVLETTGLGAAIGCKLFMDQINGEEIKNYQKNNDSFKEDRTDYHQDKKRAWVFNIGKYFS